MLKRKTKRARFGAATVAIIALATSLLGGSPSFAAKAPSSTSANKLRSLLFVNPLPKYPQWRLIGDCVAKQAKALGVPETEAGPSGGTLDAGVMIQQVQQGIANHVGAILTFPASAAFEPLFEQARKAGIIVGTMYGGGDFKAANVDIGADFAQLAKSTVQAIAERKGPQHVGLLVVGPSGAGKAYSDGFMAAAKKTKNVTVVAVVYTNDNPTVALEDSINLLTTHPDITILATHMGTVTQGATQAIKEKGYLGKAFLVGNGATGAALQGLKEGTIYRMLLQSLCAGGTSAVNALVGIAAGKPEPAFVPVPIMLVGLKDYYKYMAKGWS